MNDRSRASQKLPSGLSPAAEARWWDEHETFWETTATPDEFVPPQQSHRTRPVNLRLPIDMVEALKVVAARHSLPYQTLIRMWLKERLDEESAERRSGVNPSD